MWKNAPPWMIVTRDVLCFLLGVLGMGYLIRINSSNIVLILGCLSLTGVPGIAAIVALITGQGIQPPNSQNGTITEPSSPSSSPSSPSP